MKFIFLLSIFTLPLCAEEKPNTSPKPTKQLEVNGIAATVNGKVITKKEVAMLLGPTAAQLNAQIPRRGPEYEKQLSIAHGKILDELIDRALILTEFKQKGGAIKPQAINEEIDRQKREAYNGNNERFLEELRNARLTLDGYRKMTEEKLVVQGMRQSKFSDIAPPLPDEIQREYNVEKIKLRDITGDKISFKKIYIPASDPQNPIATPETQLALSEDIVKQLKGNADFSELAKKHSRDAFSEKGGQQDNVPRTDLAPEFANLMMEAKEGIIIGPLMDRNGLTIIKVISKNYGPVPPLSKIREQIEQRVSRKKTAERYERWIKTMRSKAMISRKR
jgi:peptidyl-prolyl cis-trans isomerase SurA